MTTKCNNKLTSERLKVNESGAVLHGMKLHFPSPIYFLQLLGEQINYLIRRKYLE